MNSVIKKKDSGKKEERGLEGSRADNLGQKVGNDQRFGNGKLGGEGERESNFAQRPESSNYVRRPRLIPRRLLETVGRGVSLVKEGGVDEDRIIKAEKQKENDIKKDLEGNLTKPMETEALSDPVSRALKKAGGAAEAQNSINDIFGGQVEYQVVYKSKDAKETKEETSKEAIESIASFKETPISKIKTESSDKLVVRPRGGSDEFFDTERLERLQELAKKAKKEKNNFRKSEDTPRLQFGFQPLGDEQKRWKSRGSVWREKLAAKLTSSLPWDEHSLPWGSTSSSLPPSSPSSSSSASSTSSTSSASSSSG